MSEAAGLETPATLTITVRHIIDAGGDLKIGVYDAANYAMKGGVPVARKSVHARGPMMSFTFDDIPPGIYAAKVLQDVNQNGNFDFGPKGMEPFGFSNDPEVTVGLPPSAGMGSSATTDGTRFEPSTPGMTTGASPCI